MIPGAEGLTLTPIGVVRSPYIERVEAPRQANVVSATGTIELCAGRGFEHALEDLDGFSHVWILFWFHRNTGWRPKVLPPRSDTRRGVFATRSPHRPNSVGMSVVRLVSVAGLRITVADHDLLDGTPVLDIKPYVPYADCVPQATSGWIADAGEIPPTCDIGDGPPRDPGKRYEIVWSERARDQLSYLQREFAVDLATGVEQTLTLGPQPHPYRRIRRADPGLVLAVRDWRVYFLVEGTVVTIDRIATGYRARQLAAEPPPPELFVHRAFDARWGR